MAAQVIKARARFFVAVEGDSEQSFVRWVQMLSENDHHIHLDVVQLGGGGFKSMLERAVRVHKRRCGTSGAYRGRFLIIDSDRAEQGDWSIEELRISAAKNAIIVCAQSPNHEGLLLRMMPCLEREMPEAASAETKLKRRWPGYQKPVNAHTLARRFSIDDLLRVGRVDADLGLSLKAIGML